MRWRIGFVLLAGVAWLGCEPPDRFEEDPRLASEVNDGGNVNLTFDAGTVVLVDAGGTEPEADAGDATPFDAGDEPDAGEPDAGEEDAGVEPEPDAGSGFAFGTPGPWPIANKVYGSSHGIKESPVVGVTTDEAQNLWVATHSALYLMRPGQLTFKRYGVEDGLHLMSNPVLYNDSSFTGDPAQNAVPGAAASPGIIEIEGGGPDEVFIGYAGNDEGDGTKADPNRHSGKIDRVKLNDDGSLRVDRFDLVANNHGMYYWHNRTVYRLLYDHFIHKHELYAGTNHGVTLLYPDKYKAPVGAQYPDTVYMDWMGDHLHARVCYHAACDGTPSNQRMGEWRGLALTADGTLWTAGRWTAGAIRWTPEIRDWYMTPRKDGRSAFTYAFGDPYPISANDVGFVNEPVFRVPQEGDAVNLSAVSVAPDGKVWFASGPWYGSGVDAVEYGVASFNGRSFTTYDPVSALGAPERNVRDLIALPDGRIAIGFKSAGVLIWNPATGDKKWLQGGSGLADGNVMRMELDTMVDPPALHVATHGGAAVIRVLP